MEHFARIGVGFQLLTILTKRWIFRKSGPWTPLEKTNLTQKFSARVKNSFLTISSVRISNMTIVFLILAQKNPNKVFLVQNLGIFIILQNVTIRQIQGH